MSLVFATQRYKKRGCGGDRITRFYRKAACADTSARLISGWGGAGLQPHVPIPRRQKKGRFPSRNLPNLQRAKLFCSLNRLGSSLGSGRISLLASSRRIALLGATLASRSLGSSSFRSSGISSCLLVGVSTAANHGYGSQNDDQRENLFHSVKRLINTS